MASGVRAAVMLVQEAAAAREVQQGQAEQSRANTPQTRQSRVLVGRKHTIQLTPLHSQLDAQKELLVALLPTIRRYESLTRP